MTTQIGLEIRGLRKTYGERVVLDIDELSFEAGQTYALIGANGSGKSTLLRLLAGVSDATSGTFEAVRAAEAHGDAATQPRPYEVSIGYMPQKSYVFGYSVFKNVALALEGLSLEQRELEERVNRALAAVGMLELAQSRGGGLSGGEAQRVALARMIVRPHDVLLLDEPTASMDVAGTLQVEEALQNYVEETGCLLVVATHTPSQARRIARKVVMLDSGRVVEQGDTANVLNSPQSAAGRAFLSYWAV